MNKPLILLTNDDGIYAPGIRALQQALTDLGQLYVVAPLVEKSAVGHAITISDPLRVQEIERDGRFFGYAVNGTPADCVKLGCKCILPRKPDLVVSGINQGPNTATNVIYSGTVSAAAEGAIMDIPAIAVSIASFTRPEFAFAAKITRKLALLVLQNGLPERTVLNVNVPAVPEQQIEGIVVTRQGKGRYEEAFDKRVDPNNRIYYWLTGKRMILDQGNDVDDLVVMQNKVSITPIQYDLTNYAFIKELRKWNIQS
ncbi:5'/3'-nucleotidase SurE [Candidatus Parcubacteria bacterium]|nr:MAG: 5'/3'-nucleotidase SurE [Candidatus Parcubacteria bacterium]